MNLSRMRHWYRSVHPLGILLLPALVAGFPGCSQPDSQTANPAPVAATPAPVPMTNMVRIHHGSFVRQRQLITLTEDYWLGRYEVTQGEYETVLGRNPSHFKGDPQRPVEKVRFTEAQEYCAAVTRREAQAGRLPSGYAYRLPSEAEWEYACRAGTTNLFSFGNAETDADAYAWTLENSDSTSHPVGLKRPNPWGLYDMHGNVWEWCSDWFEPFPATPLVDPVGPPRGTFKVFRGGSWNMTADFTRSPNRFMMSPTNGIHYVGFRLALGRARE
jgi:formylglycine-generating enzyme required for sulfatase activity